MPQDRLQQPGTELSRRNALALGGGLLAAGTLAKAAILPDAARAQQPAKRGLTAQQWAGDPWIADKLGDFDLTDIRENRLATLKISNNLLGAVTYIPMITRAILGPRGRAGSVLYGHVGMWKWQLQNVDPLEFPDAPAGSVVQRAEYTGVILDPHSYEPVEQIYNAVLDKYVTPEDSVFAESYLFFPMGGGQSVDRPGFMDDDSETHTDLRPMPRFGDDIVLCLDGIFLNEGPHQPRADCSMWTMDYHDVMDPRRQLRHCDYNFAGLLFAGERGWTGHTMGDEAQILWNVKGTKVHDLDHVPDIAKRNILDRYPERA